jgi:hypothetical protein
VLRQTVDNDRKMHGFFYSPIGTSAFSLPGACVSFELFNRFPYSMRKTGNSISLLLNIIVSFDSVQFSRSSSSPAEEKIAKDETNLISTTMPKGTILPIIMLFAFAVLE